MQLDFFLEPIDVLRLELQELRASQDKLRRSVFKRINDIELSVNKLAEHNSFSELEFLREKLNSLSNEIKVI